MNPPAQSRCVGASVGELFPGGFWGFEGNVRFLSSVQRARVSSSSVLVFTFCTDDVIFCMQDFDFVFRVFPLRPLLRFDVRGRHFVSRLSGDLTWTC